LKLSYDEPLSNFAFKFNLRHYTEGLAARDGAVVYTSVDNSDAERQMAALEAAVARHCDDLAQELKRHHALADSAHRFTSDAAELLVGPPRTAPVTPPTLF
jgi:hypothetical protein